MNDVGSPLAHLVDPKFAESKDRKVSCCICGGEAVLDGFLAAVLRTWNDRATRKEDFITPADLEIPCDACTPILFERKHAASEKENEQTTAYLRMLLAGTHDGESRAWLRRHGLGKWVDRQLAKEGTSGADRSHAG